jgi:hypothetical protein
MGGQEIEGVRVDRRAIRAAVEDVFPVAAASMGALDYVLLEGCPAMLADRCAIKEVSADVTLAPDATHVVHVGNIWNCFPPQHASGIDPIFVLAQDWYVPAPPVDFRMPTHAQCGAWFNHAMAWSEPDPLPVKGVIDNASDEVQARRAVGFSVVTLPIGTQGLVLLEGLPTV